MKLAVAITNAQAPPSAFTVWRGFEQSIMKASEFGYHGIELALKTATEVDPVKLGRLLSQTNLEISCISTGQVFSLLGLYFTHPDREFRENVINVFSELIHLCTDFGQMINVGRARGFKADYQTWKETKSLFWDTAGRIFEEAEKHKVTVVIEPVNRYETNFINSVVEGIELLEQLSYSNVGLMPDTFHMNIEESKIGESLTLCGRWMKYIHFADSNRQAPGQGHIDFDEVFLGLRKAMFDGWASIEILPLPDPNTAARQAAEYMIPRIEHYNSLGVSNSLRPKSISSDTDVKRKK